MRVLSELDGTFLLVNFPGTRIRGVRKDFMKNMILKDVSNKISAAVVSVAIVLFAAITISMTVNNESPQVLGTSVAKVTGTQGPQGIQGPQGMQGNQGLPGLRGVAGTTG